MSALANATKMTSGQHTGYYQVQSLCDPANPEKCIPAAGSGAEVYPMYRISKSDAQKGFTQGIGLPDVDPNFVYLPIIHEETKANPRNYVYAGVTGDYSGSPSEDWCPAHIDPCVAGRECAVCPKTSVSQETPIPSGPTVKITTMQSPATTIPPNLTQPDQSSLWQSVSDTQVLGVNIWLIVIFVIIGLFTLLIFGHQTPGGAAYDL